MILKISVEDGAGNVTVESDYKVKVSTSLRVENLLNGPNPFNPNNHSTYIEYNLSFASNLDIYIYSISGKRLWHKQVMAGDSGGTAGFNSIAWDGRNFYGEIVANGVYIVYVTADSEGDKVMAKTKIAVLK